MSTPMSRIFVCSGVPMNNRYDHTIIFSTRADQEDYFTGRVTKVFNDYTYLRRAWNIRVAAKMEEARAWSYLFFMNGQANDTKTYYYFINHVEYINDNTVELTLELDVMQTYMFDWTLRKCYVEREHAKNDTWGANTLDEGLDGGDLITAKVDTFDLSNDLVIMGAFTIEPNYTCNPDNDGKTNDVYGARYKNVYSGFMFTATPLDEAYKFSDDMALLGKYGVSDALYAAWLYPNRLLHYDNDRYPNPTFRFVRSATVVAETASARPTSIDGYTPKNKKVLQYPYCFMYATNNNGGAAVYQYERFETETRTFRIQGNLAPDAVIKLVPTLYKGVAHNYDEALSMGSYPLCPMNTDPYKLWLAQNQSQQNMGLVANGLKIAGGVIAAGAGIAATVASGGTLSAAGIAGLSAGGGLITSGATGIASQLAQQADKDIQPPQSRGSYSGSHNLSNFIQNFDIHHKTIDAYHAEMIDNYFTMYGYATRKVKVPNINSRPAFNYVKTIGSNVRGDFCQEDLQTINAIFDRGITFWKPTVEIGNYSAANDA